MGWSPSNDRRKWVATLDLVDCSRAVKFMLTVRRKTDFQLLRELIWTCWASIDSLEFNCVMAISDNDKWYIITGF